MDQSNLIEVTRELLYQQVWTTPMSRLCKTYGLSDVGLAKICGNWDIPCPPRGYWAKKRNGKSVRQSKLKPIEEGNPVLFTCEPGPPEEPEPQRPPKESDRRRTIEKRVANRIVVSTQIIEPHPFITRTETSIRSAKVDDSGIVRPKARQCLSLAVSPGMIDRALCILDTALKALEARGFPVSVTDDDPPQTQVRVLDEDIRFRLLEEVEHRERTKEFTQKQLDEFRFWGRPRKQYENVPSGRLVLQIDTCYGMDGRWSDRKNQRVENQLNHFVVGLVRAAESIKQERIDAEIRRKEHEERERQRQEEEIRRREEERRRQEQERRRQEEEARFRQVMAEAAAWTTAEQVRAYLTAVRHTVVQKVGVIEAGSDLDSWLTWAEGRVDAIDPLKRSATSPNK